MELAEVKEPEPGSPEWSIREIMQIRLLPFPSMDLPNSNQEDAVVGASATVDAEEFQKRVAQTREIRRQRNQDIVKLSMDALAKSAKDPTKEDAFVAAVHHFLDAHLQLALQGDETSIAALYDAAEAFYARKPNSPAAAEAQLTLVNLAHANALRYSRNEPRWLQEFSRHAQLFATRFPDEEAHSLPLLLSAGRSCELNGLLDDARSCFQLIQKNYPSSPQAGQSAAILRRLNLRGQKLDFGGPTLDGNHVDIADHAGKTVIVVFWATHAKPFLDGSEILKGVGEKYRKYAQVLSVCLDSEENEVDQYLEKANLGWPVIFHVEQDKRGWNSPLAAYYGITTLPTIWIIDPNGVVAETEVTAETLEAQLRDVILKHRTAGSQNSGETPTRS